MKKKMNSKNLTTRQLLQMVEKKIKVGQIKVDEDFYGHGIGLSGRNYEFRFPNGWYNPQCYRIVVGPNGEQREDKEWGNSLKSKKEETKKVFSEFVKKAKKHKTDPKDFSQTIICGREEFAETEKQKLKKFKN